MILRTRKIRITGAIGVGLIAVIVGAAACSADTNAATSTSAGLGIADVVAGPSAAEGAPPKAGDSGSAAGGGAAAAGGTAAQAPAAATVPALDNRQVVRTADLQLRLAIDPQVLDADLNAAQRDTLNAAVANTRAQAISSGGFIGDLQQSTGSASMVIRIPADKFDGFLTAASALGEVTSRTESAQDVTDQYTDVQSRVATMQTSVDRLRALLAQATGIADIITIESELTSRQAELESLEGRLAVLKDQVGLSTISITLTAARDSGLAPEPAPKRGGFLGGLASGWSALLALLSAVGVFLGTVLPFLPIVLIVPVVIWVWRRRNRRAQFQQSQAALPKP